MKKYNINHTMYIQITEKGWQHLRNTVGEDYIKHCIDTEHYRKKIDGETWYKLQCHQVFDLLPAQNGMSPLFNTNVMFDDSEFDGFDDSCPLSEAHPCYKDGHNMYLITEIDNGRSKFGEHKCSRCGYTEPFQFDYN